MSHENTLLPELQIVAGAPRRASYASLAPRAVLALITSGAVALGCEGRNAPPKAAGAVLTAPAPDSFLIALATSRGPIVVIAHRRWAPRGVDRFYSLVRAGFFDDARFFRVVKGFVAQFGMPADPKLGQAWSTQALPDDSVRHSNRHGAVSFASAGPNTRTTQLFINLADNVRLDTYGGVGFPPIGEVVEGLAQIDSLNADYGEAPSQDSIRLQGNAYLTRVFPMLDYIKSARVAREWR
jgi:peptidyl-prolyl cis-trans isomerase A (cyclophilin A)